MNPDFTLIWPLSCPKDGDHFSLVLDDAETKALMKSKFDL